MGTESQKMNYETAASFLSVFANSKRLAILALISRGEIRVGELATLTGLSQSALSQHLAVMRSSHLVTTRRDAQTIYYSCSSAAAKTLLDALDALFPPLSTELSDELPVTTRSGLHAHAKRSASS